MADVSQIQIENDIYTLKDKIARTDLSNLMDTLGNLAFKDAASGAYTPEGTITGISGSVTTSKKDVRILSQPPTLPSWSANVNTATETLSFSFSAGSIPTTTQSVVTNITDVEITGAKFTGKEGSISVS